MRTIEQIKASIVSERANVKIAQTKALESVLAWVGENLTKAMKVTFDVKSEALREVAKAGGLVEAHKGKGGGFFVSKAGFKASKVSSEAIDTAMARLEALAVELKEAESTPETEGARQQRLFLAMAEKLGLKGQAAQLLAK